MRRIDQTSAETLVMRAAKAAVSAASTTIMVRLLIPSAYQDGYL
ncbi:MAG: hypothetical protein AVDCRST_MAG91-2103 [uncultured Sphingomonadaceae bacterium]|uniref:Uncharacterized protein n=1 Tax=uncultured Sphingomonadaceae bacterium TaxID=169976 RepID=A0A6J4TCT8_9SPHN|nr:MAG: hypothetical protein AVDCRST_MAG91-2103 [uncultured Sphingomonadaceae bacterium]